MRAILQSEASECGLACLAMISGAHGLYLDLTELRRRFSISLKGATLATLIRHAQSLGFAARPLRLDMPDLAKLRVPCVLHWDLNHFVVLKKASANTAVILDPAIGEKRIPLSELSHHFTGVALELTPTAEFVPADHRRTMRLRDLTGKVLGLRSAMLLLSVLALALEIFALAAPLFNQFVVDEVIVSGDRELLSVLMAGFMLLLVTQTAISLVRSWIILRLTVDVRLQWTSSLFSHLVRLPTAFFEKRHLGDIVSRFGSITTMQNTLTTATVAAVLDGIMAILALVMMVLYSVRLAMVITAAVAIYGLLRWAFYRPLRDANEERLIVAARENSHFLESLRAIVPIKLAGFEAERRARWQNLLTEVFDRDIRTQRLTILFSTAATFLAAVATLGVFAIGASEVMDGALTVGMLLAFASYATTFTTRVSALVGYGIDFRMLSLHAERVADIALEKPEAEPAQETDVARLAPRIELRNVSFRYAEGEPWVLQNVNLSVEPGESIAIVGPSGCGKTTLIKILLGLLEPSEGEVLLDNVSVRRLGLVTYRRLIGAVLQDDALLAGSIAENISFFDTAADPERVAACAYVAAIHEEIAALPMGYQTLVGDMGTSLSGGQKQRVLLARAIYKQPKILVLDEATSHLDVFNERRINQALDEMKLTRVVVAHRQETIGNAERVVMLGTRPLDLTPENSGEKEPIREMNSGIFGETSPE